MMKAKSNFVVVAVMYAIVSVFIGCATIEKDTTMDTERLLSASGFQMRMADTPQKLDKVKSMPQKKLIRHNKDGDTHYVYADANDCKCLYVGTEKAYMKFKELAAVRLSSDDYNARDENVMMDWEVWGGEPGSAWQYWD